MIRPVTESFQLHEEEDLFAGMPEPAPLTEAELDELYEEFQRGRWDYEDLTLQSSLREAA